MESKLKNGADLIDINEAGAAERVGDKIRDARIAKGLSQVELGEMVHLTGDRIQKYENGARRPKNEMLKEIANALGIEAVALTDPVLTNYYGAMYALFDMERLYNLRVEREEGRVVLVFGDGRQNSNEMNVYLNEWEKEIREIEIRKSGATDEEHRKSIENEYNMWKWTFPRPIAEKTQKTLKLQRVETIDEQIAELTKLKEELLASIEK